MKEGRYEVCLPWRGYREPLADSFALSHRQLHGLIRRMKQEPKMLREYDAIICDQLNRGIVETVPDAEDKAVEVHYLSYHPVIRRDKTTTKPRVIYDASAGDKGPSLNNFLHIGPKFNQKILDIFLRFRSYPIAMIADIKKASL